MKHLSFAICLIGLVSCASTIAFAQPTEDICDGGVAYQPQQPDIALAGDIFGFSERPTFCALRAKFPKKDGQYFWITSLNREKADTVVRVDVQQFYEDGQKPTVQSCQVSIARQPVPTPAGSLIASDRMMWVFKGPVCTPKRELK